MSEFASYAETARDPLSFARYWHGQIKLAKDMRQDWTKDCESAIDTFSTKVRTQFNILYSNVQTRASARYNSTPAPDVRPAHMDVGRDGAKSAARIIERALMQQLDSYNFDGVIRAAILNDEITGQGVVRVFWETDSYEEIDTGPNGEDIPRDVIRQEFAVARYVPHGHYLEGPAHTWDEVPWQAFKVFLTRDELTEMGVDPVIVRDLAFDHQIARKENRDEYPEAKGDDRGVGYECCWQVWDKRTRSVVLLSEGYEDAVLMIDDDPVPRLPDFFPAPEPLQCIRVPGSRIPVCPYNLYRDHADQMGEITKRIMKLVRIARYRGFVAGEDASVMLALENLSDGEFAPLPNATMFAQGGVDRAIYEVPLDRIIQAIQTLIQVRDQIKQTIYEVTGLSDVLRGATDPTETATAQQIKSQFGSLRIQDAQREVQRFVRDILRLKGDIIATHFSDETLLKIAAPDQNNQRIMQEFQLAMQFVRSDEARYYRVDIETDSTIQGDLTRSQENAARFLGSAAQFGQTFVPMVQQFGLPAAPLLKLFQAVSNQYKLGKQAELAVEEMLEMVEQQQRANPPEEEEAKKQEAEQMQREMARAELAKTQSEAEENQMDALKTRFEAEGQQIENAMQVAYAPQGADPDYPDNFVE